MNKPLLHVPENARNHNILGYYIREWEKNGWISTKTVPDGRLIWLDDVGRTLLWPWPQSRHPVDGKIIDSLAVDAKARIYFNEVPSAPDCHAAFFWARNPYRVEALGAAKGARGYRDRATESIFIGKIENKTQARYRSDDSWREVIQEFSLVGSEEPYVYSQDEYLERLLDSRYGLSLRGYGPKCNREVELLGLGTVLVAPPEVDTYNYHRPLVEGQHFLRVATSMNAKELFLSTSPDEWDHLSNNGRQWYRDNASFAGAFATLCEVFEKANS